MPIKEKNKNGSMYVCMVAAFFAIAHMYTGSSMFMLLFTVLIASAILFEHQENKIDYIIFFSTWAYVLKFNPKSHSMFLFFSVEYCILTLLCLFTKNKKINLNLMCLLLFFLGHSFVVSAFSSSGVNNILGILINYLTIALAIMNSSDTKNFKKWIWLYVVGLLIQSFVAFWALESFGQVGDYLRSMRDHTVLTSSGVITRFAGFESDPNYFSVEILVGICSLLVYMMHEKKKLFACIAMGMLAIFGLLTLSKMYLLCLAILIIVALFMTFKQDIGSGISLLLVFLILSFVIWKMFGETLLLGFGARLDGVDNIAGLTTGRTNSWVSYFTATFGDIKILLFGAGYGSGFVNRMAAHNGYLSLFYFWGIIGSILLIALFRSLDRNFSKKVDFKIKGFFDLKNIGLIIILLANFSLDCVLMDFFPMAVFLTIVCRHYSTLTNENLLNTTE